MVFWMGKLVATGRLVVDVCIDMCEDVGGGLVAGLFEFSINLFKARQVDFQGSGA